MPRDTRKCIRCKKVFPKIHFSSEMGYGRWICPACDIPTPGMARGYPKSMRNGYYAGLRNRYGLSRETVDQLIAASEGRCDICNKVFPIITKYPGDYLCIDHDHQTDKVRGILCGDCNNALGRVHDSPAVLQRMIEYLANA